MYFEEVVNKYWDEICNNFMIGLSSRGYKYDRDIMEDTFISCYKTLQNKPMNKKDIIKYLWTAYINKYKTFLRKNTKRNSIICSENEIKEDPSENLISYDTSCDRIYDIILKEVKNKYGSKNAMLWELHVCQGKSIKEIHDLGYEDVDNLISLSRKIKRFILNNLIPSHKELQELVKYRYD